MTTTGWIVAILSFAVALVLGFAACTLIRRRKEKNDQRKIEDAEQEALRIVNEAIKSSENKKREALLEAKEEILKNRSEYEKEVKERRAEQQKQERRLQQKEENLDRKTDDDRKEGRGPGPEARSSGQGAARRSSSSSAARPRCWSAFPASPPSEAKKYLIDQVESEVTHETALKIKEIEARAKDEADQRAREIVATAIQRCAADHVAEITVSVVPLPNDEMKGRIIGREGRNIRTIEDAHRRRISSSTTRPRPSPSPASSRSAARSRGWRWKSLSPTAASIPPTLKRWWRRPAARWTPSSSAEGERAVLETGVRGLHPELVKLLGRLHYRTSYGQNVLQHSIEVSASRRHDGRRAGRRRARLPSAPACCTISARPSTTSSRAPMWRSAWNSPRKYHEKRRHHPCHPGAPRRRGVPQTVVACLVQAADAISAARPGRAAREPGKLYQASGKAGGDHRQLSRR